MPYSWVTLDPYAELGIPRDASQQDIKLAYRRIALASHPDRNASDPAAGERFRRATQSYSLLRDPERRLAFDQTGRWDDARLVPEDLDVQLAEALEIFSRDIGMAAEPRADDRTPAHTSRITIAVDISYDDVEHGAHRTLPAPCPRCAGSGAREGSTQVRCTSCGGSGRLRHVESSLLGPRIHTEPCESCHGSGRRPLLACAGCSGSGRAPGGETVEVLIPQGTADGDSLPSVNGNGSQFVARLLEDQRWGRDGADLYAVARIPYAVAVLGGTVDIDLPARKHRVEIAPGTASGHRVRVPGHGLPLRDGSGRGSLILTVHIAVPERPGALERWLLRAGRSRAPASASGFTARVAGLQARTRDTAVSRWRLWRQHQHNASLLRIEKAAGSMRAAAGLLSESEQRLGPLLEHGFPVIAPEAAQARQRLDNPRARSAALAEAAVDATLVAVLATGLWLIARFAGINNVAADELAWWDVLRRTHPAFFPLVPVLAGVIAGVIGGGNTRRLTQRLIAVPLGVAVAAAAAATGGMMFAIGMRIAPEADIVLSVAMSVMFAMSVGSTPIFLFLLADSFVGSARAAVEEQHDRADKQILRKYDAAAARLGTHLEGTERAFRQLLTRSDDARRPLTSLLNSAADSLAADRLRHPRAAVLRPALTLVGAVGLMALWIATTALAAAAALARLPASQMLVQLTVAAAVVVLCGVGAILPRQMLEHYRHRVLLTGIASVAALGALAAYLIIGAYAPLAWISAIAAAAALTLSFRMPDAVRATNIALTIVISAGAAALLWPIAAVHALFGRGTARS